MVPTRGFPYTFGSEVVQTPQLQLVVFRGHILSTLVSETLFSGLAQQRLWLRTAQQTGRLTEQDSDFRWPGSCEA